MKTNETILANAADVGSPFAILQPDGFLVPYGKFPHKQGLQIFDRTAAENMVREHNGLLTRLTRWAAGGSYPVYIGHPDLPGSKDTDKRAYGWIENMAVKDEGLHLSVKWSDAGRELVENAHFKFYSPLWWTKPVKGGIQPVAMKSMGLTNDPNIPVPALANESETEDLKTQDAREEEEFEEREEGKSNQENEELMDKKIMDALGLEEGATADDVVAKITALKDVAANKEEAETTAEEMKANAKKSEEYKETAENEATAARERVTELEARLGVAANEVVARAVDAGKLTPAEVPEKVAELLAANDYAAAVQGLCGLPAKFKTESKTGDLGSQKSRLMVAANDECKARREERAQLVANEYQRTNPNLSETERKKIAWQRAQAKNPEAFSKKSPGAAA